MASVLDEYRLELGQAQLGQVRLLISSTDKAVETQGGPAADTQPLSRGNPLPRP